MWIQGLREENTMEVICDKSTVNEINHIHSGLLFLLKAI